MNHFEFYDLPMKFFLDEMELKQHYFAKSKEFYPDFHRGNDDEYERALEKSSQNNAAYKALKTFTNRVEYILKEKGELSESKNSLNQSFLMEMMDVNEAIMDLRMNFDAQKASNVISEVSQQQEKLDFKIKRLATAYDDSQDDAMLGEIKEIYLKQKYVLRLKESLNTFAPQ